MVKVNIRDNYKKVRNILYKTQRYESTEVGENLWIVHFPENELFSLQRCLFQVDDQ